MIPITDYCKIKGVDLSTVYRWIDKTKVLKLGNSIVDPEMEQLTDKSKDMLIKDLKKSFEAMILKAHYQKDLTVPTVTYIQTMVKKYATLGMVIKGYASRSVYRKIEKPHTMKRKIRNDAGEHQNKNLLECYNDFISLASNFYLKNANQSINYTIDLVIHAARKDQDLYRIAAVPKPTLYRAFNQYVKSHSIDEIHTFLNHHNIWDQQKAKVTGAFTDDEIQFMDYMIGDDHNSDVHQVLEFSKLKNELENKSLYSYFIIEAKSQKVLAFMIKTSAIVSDDVILLMMQAFAEYGKPRKGILIDNGRINKSEEVKQFISKIETDLNPTEGMLKYSKAYQPTEKSPGERIFGYIKEEHDCFFNNFRGSDHKNEGRHFGLSMTPAPANYTFEEFVASIENYINGIYQERERTRKINGKNVKISIKDYFEKGWNTYEPGYVSAGELRYAYMKEAETPKLFRNELTHKGETYIPQDYLGISYNGKHYRIADNPHDLSQIDMYATQRFTDTKTGAVVQPGDFVATLYRTRTLVNRRGAIAKRNKEHKKAVIAMAEVLVDQSASASHEVLNLVNSQVQENGKVKKTRKAVVKAVSNELMSTVPEVRVRQIIETHASKDALSIHVNVNDDVTMQGGTDNTIDSTYDPLFDETI